MHLPVSVKANGQRDNMRSLLHVVAGHASGGECLPEILPSLGVEDVTFRRGQLHVVAAVPGGGKTLLALWYAVKSKVPTLYFSADSDSSTIAERAGAILLGKKAKEVKAMLAGEASVLIEDALADGANHIRFDFDSGPNIESIEQELLAYCELYGDMPALVIVDNLMNIHGDSDNEWTSMRDSMSALHTLARDTEAAFIVLHHVSEAQSESKPDYPAPRRALMGKVAALPEVVLTVALSGSQYRICAVKNRHGQSYPKADRFITVAADLPYMTLYNSSSDMEQARTRREWQ